MTDAHIIVTKLGEEVMLTMNQSLLPYKVGGLLYTPAISVGIADKIAQKAYPGLTSIAFCLEDSIKNEAIEQAEIELHRTLAAIKAKNLDDSERPLIFVRTRTPEHMERVHNQLLDVEDILTGFILPKFDLSNGYEYAELIQQVNAGRQRSLYIMPILERKTIADIGGRDIILLKTKEILDGIRDYVLNIRVGGNDFCHLYGLRRSVNQNIYEIGVIRDILIDIVNVFAADYIVSGPVWEYFGKDKNGDWAKGLKSELALDRLNGFIGKTSIHPSQLPIIYESMKVSNDDYEDALNILDWVPENYAVAKSANGSRMNEMNCHARWATRIYTLGQIYGIREDESNATMV